MPKKTICIIEPSYYGLGFVDAAFARGYDIISVAASKDNPKKYNYENKIKDVLIADIRDSKSVLNAIKASKYYNKLDALISGNDYVVIITGEVAALLGLKYIPPSVMINARWKDKTRKALDEFRLPNAKFAIVTDFNAAKEAAKNIGYPIIVKPTACACSQNVSLIKDEKGLRTMFDMLATFDTTYLDFKVRKIFLVEEYIDGDEFSIELFMLNGRAIYSSVTEKIKYNPPFFTEIGHVVPTSVHVDKVRELIDAAVKSMNAVGVMDGPSHVEMRLSPRGPIVMEINPRMGGDRITQDLVPNAFGVNLFDATLDYYLDQPMDLVPKKNMASAIANLTVRNSGVVRDIKGLEKIDKMNGIVSKNIKLKIGDIVKPPESNDDRYGYVISIGDTPAMAKKIAFDAINSIECVVSK